MNTFQWIMIGLAAVLVAPVLWKQAKDFIPKRKPVEVTPTPNPVIPQVDSPDCDLVDVVECWEHLIECCKANEMTEAVDEIYKVFPLFANKGVK